jgi:transposase
MKISRIMRPFAFTAYQGVAMLKIFIYGTMHNAQKKKQVKKKYITGIARRVIWILPGR